MPGSSFRFSHLKPQGGAPGNRVWSLKPSGSPPSLGLTEHRAGECPALVAPLENATEAGSSQGLRVPQINYIQASSPVRPLNG